MSLNGFWFAAFFAVSAAHAAPTLSYDDDGDRVVVRIDAKGDPLLPGLEDLGFRIRSQFELRRSEASQGLYAVRWDHEADTDNPAAYYAFARAVAEQIQQDHALQPEIREMLDRIYGSVTRTGFVENAERVAEITPSDTRSLYFMARNFNLNAAEFLQTAEGQKALVGMLNVIWAMFPTPPPASLRSLLEHDINEAYVAFFGFQADLLSQILEARTKPNGEGSDRYRLLLTFPAKWGACRLEIEGITRFRLRSTDDGPSRVSIPLVEGVLAFLRTGMQQIGEGKSISPVAGFLRTAAAGLNGCADAIENAGQ